VIIILKVVELFAGIGAWSKALKRMNIDFEIVDAIEFDEKTMKSYNIIHNTNFKSKDITKIDPYDIPDCDIIFYSPPCQAFSVAGKQEGFGDSRGTLFFDAFKIIQAKKPKYAIMENVKGLTQKKFQFEFETMIQLLEQEGYKNYWKVLNAKDYGIPQNRERVFIVSIREDIEQEFEFPQPFDSGLRLRDLLENEVDEKYYISEEKTKCLLQKYKKEIKNKDNNPSELSLNGKSISYCLDAHYGNGLAPSSINKGKRTHILEVKPCITPDRINKKQNGRRFKEDGEPSFTINTQDKQGILIIGLFDIKGNEQVRRVCGPEGITPILNTMQDGNRKPKVLLFEKDGGYYFASIRKFTPFECLRLMGFNDSDYIKLKKNKISDSQIYKMAGNSIVVNTIECLLKELPIFKNKFIEIQ